MPERTWATMKFGKSYLDALARPDFPEEWRQGVIEYKSLKKLINGVAAELEGLGLSQSVLQELLDQSSKDKQDKQHTQQQRPSSSSPPNPSKPAPQKGAVATTNDTKPNTAQDWLERVPHKRVHRHRTTSGTEPGSDTATGPTSGVSDADDTDQGSSSRLQQLLGSNYATESEEVILREGSDGEEDGWVHGSGGRRAHAAYELAGTPDHPASRIRITIESPVTTDATNAESEPEPEPEPNPPLHLPPPSLDPSGPVHLEHCDHHLENQGQQHGEPRHRPDQPSAQAVRQAQDEQNDEADSEPDEEEEDEDHVDTPSITTTHLGRHASKPSSLAETEIKLASQDTSDLSGINEVNLNQLSLTPRRRRLLETRTSPHTTKKKKKKLRKVRRRQVLIPLLADAQFLDLFTQALVAVQSVQSLQRKEFIAATQRLTQAIGQATSPTGKNQQDLYAWREIFQIWTDAQIFESTREADAGELPPDESERRLRQVADELHRRGWLKRPLQESRIDTTTTLPRANSISAASKRSPPGSNLHRVHSASEVQHSGHNGEPHHRIGLHLPGHHAPSSPPPPPPQTLSAQSAQALEDFMSLNMSLLDVKKYQQVNLEAARKILKKHDKRTALSAGTDLKQFMARGTLPPRTNHKSEEDLAPPPDPVAIANAVANGQLDESHRVRLGLKRWKKPVNVGGLNLGGTKACSTPSAPSAPAANGAQTKVHPHPSLNALVPASTASAGALGPVPGKDTHSKDPSESLPHILFSLMSSQLLHILPSLEEVSCTICTDVAWRPIRLDCTHLFCMRCMVKMQKQGRRDCPICRAADAVGSADERNLDAKTANVLKVWFPREVREKQKENEMDRKQEQKKELGFEDKCIIS